MQTLLSDHGPINSWDRQPYVYDPAILTSAGTGTFSWLTATLRASAKTKLIGVDTAPTAQMVARDIFQNVLVGNYGGTNGPIGQRGGGGMFQHPLP